MLREFENVPIMKDHILNRCTDITDGFVPEYFKVVNQTPGNKTTVPATGLFWRDLWKHFLWPQGLLLKCVRLGFTTAARIRHRVRWIRGTYVITYLVHRAEPLVAFAAAEVSVSSEDESWSLLKEAAASEHEAEVAIGTVTSVLSQASDEPVR